jgi:RNA polymerase sigma-70 factor (ECF subfamily)
MSKKMSMHTRNEDQALFLLIKKRDKEAFSALYYKYHAYLYAIALRYLKNKDLAEDSVQHVFIKLWENTKTLNIDINVKNYLYTMIKNHILNQIRDNKETISLNYANAQQEISDQNDFIKSMEEQQTIDVLLKGIESLPPQKKEVCLLKLEDDITNQKIADKMGISIHTVKSHYQESLKMLRDYFQKIQILLF